MTYIVALFLTIIMFPKIFISLGIFQQNQYKTTKYLKNLKKHYLKTPATYLEYLTIIMLICYYIFNWWPLIIFVIISLIVSFMLTESLIIVPTFTRRLERLIISSTLLSSIPYFITTNHALTLLIEIVFYPFLLIIGAVINLPLEKVISAYYLKKAQNKIQKISPYIIGITGSFGKTSTKNILYELLKHKFLTTKTPASYNTPMGLSKCINEQLKELSEVFIVEMGATKTGDIALLTNLTPPKIGIITEVGPQHLETFKSIDNVLKTKLEILNSNKLDILVINNDNEYLRKYNYPKNVCIKTIGIETEAMYRAHNIKLSSGGLRFDVYYKNEFYACFQTKLLAKHNIYNILLSIATADSLKIKKEDIVIGISKLEAIPHRLSLYQENNVTIIDDSFNSNIVGFKNALDTLNLYEGIKVVITPGIIDAGSSLEQINKEVAKSLAEVADYVYLIKNEASLFIEKYFREYDFTRYEVIKNFQSAYHKAKHNVDKNTTILIENDLPDNYLRR